MQWHPLFAHLLRPLVQDYYDVQINVSVGDLPRAADILLLRRARVGPLPFRGIWRHLTPWNVLEIKGPTVDPRLYDTDLLIEVGLGVERRLREEQARQGQSRSPRGDVSFWYVANHVGRRFRAEVEHLVRQPLEALGEGLWRCPCLGRWLFLVAKDALPVDADSVPLHLLSRETGDHLHQLVRQVVAEPRLWRAYGLWLPFLHPNLAQEIERMAKVLKSPLEDREFDLTRAIKFAGIRKVIEQLGLKTVIDEVGLKTVIDEVGLKTVIDQMGLENFLKELTPEQRKELKRLLK